MGQWIVRIMGAGSGPESPGVRDRNVQVVVYASTQQEARREGAVKLGVDETSVEVADLNSMDWGNYVPGEVRR